MIILKYQGPCEVILITHKHKLNKLFVHFLLFVPKDNASAGCETASQKLLSSSWDGILLEKTGIIDKRSLAHREKKNKQ